MADSEGADGGGAPPPIGSYFFPKSHFFRVKGYISLCAFAINEDGADYNRPSTINFNDSDKKPAKV